jgi:hypothetical protein
MSNPNSQLLDAREIERRYGIKRPTLRRRVLYGIFPPAEARVPETRADGMGGALKAVWRRATVEKALARRPRRNGRWLTARKLPSQTGGDRL